MPFDRFAAIFVALQHRLFYVVMAFARFNLYVNSYTFLFRKAWDTKRARGGRWAWGLEIAGLLFFWYWFGSILYGCGTWKKALAYLLVSHAVTSPLHVQARLYSNDSVICFTNINTRLFCRIFQCRRPTWVLQSPSHTDKCALLQTSSAPLL